MKKNLIKLNEEYVAKFGDKMLDDVIEDYVRWKYNEKDVEWYMEWNEFDKADIPEEKWKEIEQRRADYFGVRVKAARLFGDLDKSARLIAAALADPFWYGDAGRREAKIDLLGAKDLLDKVVKFLASAEFWPDYNTGTRRE